jgi:hypothetical protein
VCYWAIASANDLEECVGVRSFPLELDSKGGEEDDLHGRSRGIPEWSKERKAWLAR